MTSPGTVPPAASITHQHLAAVINTRLSRRPVPGGQQTVRILDMGCGDGRLIGHLLDALPLLQPRHTFEVHGFDVANAGVQVAGFMDRTIADLAGKHGNIDWNERLVLINDEEKWPYQDGRFDFITSNQVMEHVSDHPFVFGEIARCLAPGGVSINLFPTREVLFEGHALMPLVHRIRDTDRRARWMRFFAKVGFNRTFHQDMERHGWKTVDEFADMFSRILEEDTNYVSGNELLHLAEQAGLSASFLHTKDFYVAKAQSYLGKRSYDYSDWRIGEQIAFGILRHVSSVTFVMEKAG